MALRRAANLLTSNHVNYLVFRYLQEAGFTHSAFTFAHESNVIQSPLDPNSVAPGSLIALLQKGLQFLELEANLESQDGDVDGDFKMLSPEELMTLDIDSLRELVQRRREGERLSLAPPAAAGPGAAAGAAAADKQAVSKGGAGAVGGASHAAPNNHTSTSKPRQAGGKAGEAAKAAQQEGGGRGSGGKEAGGKGAKQVRASAALAQQQQQGRAARVGPQQDGPTPMDEDMPLPPAAAALSTAQPPHPPSAPEALELPASATQTLTGHSGEVNCCAWHPTEALLASVADDSTARIWSVRFGSGEFGRAVQCRHAMKTEDGTSVTSLDWSPDGGMLLTGAMDGAARVWGRDGQLKATLEAQEGTIFAVKFNKAGDLLITASLDGATVVYETKGYKVKQSYKLHEAAVMDVDWRTNTSFASCSADLKVLYVELGSPKALRTWAGHKGEVTCVRWDPSGTLCASCSDDKSARVWLPDRDMAVHVFDDTGGQGHKESVLAVRWRPAGPGSANPNLTPLLSSVSLDSLVKLWDVDKGTCATTLRGHTKSAYSCAFSPDGRLVATGAEDSTVMLWNVADGRHVRTCRAPSGCPFDIQWSPAGDRLAACYNSNVVRIIDVRM